MFVNKLTRECARPWGCCSSSLAGVGAAHLARRQRRLADKPAAGRPLRAERPLVGARHLGRRQGPGRRRPGPRPRRPRVVYDVEVRTGHPLASTSPAR